MCLYILFPKQNIDIILIITHSMFYDPEEIISGEKIQEIADLYIGTYEDFLWNPRIMEQPEKHQPIDDINPGFDNPPIVFVYGHLINIFSHKIDYFKNEFVLITHNGDTNLLKDNADVMKILNSEKLLGWWGQNVCFVHHKIHPVPIGLANSMWEHGNIEDLQKPTVSIRYKPLYLNFNIYTNSYVRQPCLDALHNYGILNMVNFKDHIQRMSEYYSCAFPEGNGVDTHRLWESLYTGCVPIVLNTPFIKTLMYYTNNQLPLIILDDWNQYNPEKNVPKVGRIEALTIDYYKRQIYDVIDCYRKK